jgi:hypothetical protein
MVQRIVDTKQNETLVESFDTVVSEIKKGKLYITRTQYGHGEFGNHCLTLLYVYNKEKDVIELINICGSGIEFNRSNGLTLIDAYKKRIVYKLNDIAEMTEIVFENVDNSIDTL